MNVLVAISGGIAAYKSATLVREFVKRGDNVKVIMTDKAKDFITPLTLATLSQNPVFVENFDPTNGAWNSHIKLGLWADVIIVAPATANTIAKMANGISDNLLLCTYLSARCDVWVAPAMDFDMYKHVTTVRNLQQLELDGVKIIEPKTGFLASGLEGKGRMAEPNVIIDAIYSHRSSNGDLSGKKIIITAGGTIEKIDPVRFISNFSTGKMGVAIAVECANRGADVILIKTTSAAECGHKNVNVLQVESAHEMYEAVRGEFQSCDVAVFAAAVADYTVESAKIKIKHDNNNRELNLIPTKDIAAEMGKLKKDQICIGFALETNNGVENAKAKLVTKNLDAIVLNSLQDKGAGFGTDTNKVTIISNQGELNFSLKSKGEVARDVVDYISKHVIK